MKRGVSVAINDPMGETGAIGNNLHSLYGA